MHEFIITGKYFENENFKDIINKIKKQLNYVDLEKEIMDKDFYSYYIKSRDFEFSINYWKNVGNFVIYFLLKNKEDFFKFLEIIKELKPKYFDIKFKELKI